MSIFLAVRNSLYGLCDDFAALQSWNASQYNFDAFAEKNALPEGDLIGLHGLSMEIDTDLITFTGMIGMATDNDANLFRLDAMSGAAAQHFLPGSQWPIKDAAGAEIGKLTIGAGTSLSPVYRAIQKPLKFLSFKAFCDRAASL